MTAGSGSISLSESTVNRSIDSLADDDDTIITWSQSELLRTSSPRHKDLSPNRQAPRFRDIYHPGTSASGDHISQAERIL